MAANTTPIFGLTPQCAFARVAAATTANDGVTTTNIITGFTAASNGSRIDRITITSAQATPATNSAMVAKIFISDTGGANYRMYKQVVMAPATTSTTAISSTQTINIPGGLILKSGQLIGCAISVFAGVQDQMDFTIEGMDF